MIWDSYDRLVAESRPERPFNSGTERDEWQARNCTTCVHDREQRTELARDLGPGCPLLMLVLLEERTPAQWIASDGEHRCVEYRHEGDGDGPEPRPVPDPPGQGVLWPRRWFEGVRMLTPLVPGVHVGGGGGS